MLEIKNERIAIPVVLFAGLLWSFGPLVVRYMDQPNLNPWQYLFTRGVVIFILLNVYLFFLEGRNFYKNYLNVGLSGLVGGCGLALAMITFILSIINTTDVLIKSGSTTCFSSNKRSTSSTATNDAEGVEH